MNRGVNLPMKPLAVNVNHADVYTTRVDWVTELV